MDEWVDGQPEVYRLLKSSFFLLQSMGGALLLERFWWARSFTCCKDKLSSGMASMMDGSKAWEENKPIETHE